MALTKTGGNKAKAGTFTGYVKYVYKKDGISTKTQRPYTSYRVVMVTDPKDVESRDKTVGEWYKLGLDGFGVEKGMYLTFQFTEDKYGKSINLDSLEEDEAKKITVAAQFSPSGSSGGGGKYDAEGAKWGNALTNAVTAAGDLMAHELVKAPGKGDKQDWYVQLILALRRSFYADNIPEAAAATPAVDATNSDATTPDEDDL